MCTKRDCLIFFAGAAAMHTISHIWLAYSNMLPITVWGMSITSQFNTTVIIVSTLITAVLLWWASKLPQ